MQQIQKELPKARVVYCSATGVSEVGNMAFMSRLVGAPQQFYSCQNKTQIGGAHMAGFRMSQRKSII